MSFLFRIYDYLARHKPLCWCLLGALLLLCAAAVWRLDYTEDISDFLPLSERQQQAMAVYQRISGAERIVVIFEGGTTDDKLDAIDAFAGLAAEKDSVVAANLTTTVDMQRYMDVVSWTYEHIPLFLTEADYAHIDSLLRSPEAVPEALTRIHGWMQMPVASFMQRTVSHDPLLLFAPMVSTLQDFKPATDAFTSLDGYMLTQDEQLAFAIVQTPYGANETRLNTRLVASLNALCEEVGSQYPDLSVRLLGAPVVAVENASRIKKDSLLAISLALIGIIALLVYCFRRNVHYILLILLTIGFGWLMAMAVMAVCFHEVSLIVIGMGSIIIGIAVNYPLHILFHQRYTTSVRQTLSEVASPLVIGNITTVGAFLALVPLQAVALRELGVFAAAMLVGTILFSIIFLPQLLRDNTHPLPAAGSEAARPPMRPALRYSLLAVLLLLTAGLYFRGRHIAFDADVSRLNYMTVQQRADFARLTSLAGESGTESVYVVEPQSSATPFTSKISNLKSKISNIKSPSRWLPTSDEQADRIQRWDMFWAERRLPLVNALQDEAARQGFRPSAFEPFSRLMQEQFSPQPIEFFSPLTDNVLQGYCLIDSSHVSLVTHIAVPKQHVQEVEDAVRQMVSPSALVFDIRQLNASVAGQLSDNFDYIGLVCSLIVFIFLWVSMRSLRTALVAFLPMAVSWIWILGLMQLLGLQFNIVNVILATFIFGQGDDYSIFVVEGLQYERATGRRMLAQFRRSIVLSALIMFIGIGVLVIARHPAMHSLGTLTLLGMTVVVLMANLLPPLISTILFCKS